ncbi:MAG: 1-acyl-sn-glycerol-3-phosphate acyltransferase [Clostridiales bacterium]|nr:1-acyl-sn-glycerol-3-phosphate acyltransferase [Clostridiales bacterium]
MKIKTKSRSWEEVQALPQPMHRKPKKPSRLLSSVMRLLSSPDLRQVRFSYEKKRMEQAGEGPWLILMNHASFLDLEIASKILFPKRYHIVCTTDALVGKEALMRNLGCIPTQKFVPDLSLITDIRYAIEKNKTSMLMYPEAGYSLDGTATLLPRRMGVLFKSLDVPVIMITTFGSFTRDPLYNNLQKRKLHVTAQMECLLTPEEIAEKSVEEIDAILDKAFSFDYFRWQQENHIRIDEPTRADGLHRILYKCACCGEEGKMEGLGTTLTCHACGHVWELDEYGFLIDKGSSQAGDSFNHIPDWFSWERECVGKEIEEGRYLLDTSVDIGILKDYKAFYTVGSGTLRQDKNGFVLDGCDGKLHYEQKPQDSYSLNSDFFWYEIGDVICIGKKDCLYYCFPKQKDVVAKARIAQEAMFRAYQQKRKTSGKK